METDREIRRVGARVILRDGLSFLDLRLDPLTAHNLSLQGITRHGGGELGFVKALLAHLEARVAAIERGTAGLTLEVLRPPMAENGRKWHGRR